jgi:uncharacterized membrane protein YciS (DUF1049 family)
VLIGLQATRILTDKRLEFFREASSGYDINAYYVAVNIVATIEHTVQIGIVAFLAAWLRNPVSSWWSYYVHFVVMTWICVSWALFFPMWVPAENVTVVTGFFMAFCGLLISGALAPVTWDVIYEGGVSEHLAGWLSPTRYFVEALAVGEYRCLPAQSGWTVEDESMSYDRAYTLMQQRGLAVHDRNATQQSCGGWYWGVLPSLFVGLTVRYAGWLAMHTSNRAQQTKKSLLFEIKRDKKVWLLLFSLLAILFGLGFLTTWLYTRDIEPNYEEAFEMKTDEKEWLLAVSLLAILFGLGFLMTWLYTRDIEPNYKKKDIEKDSNERQGEACVPEVLDAANVSSLLEVRGTDVTF